MAELVLDVRLDGFDRPIGVLARDAMGALAFAYRPDYASDPAAIPISLSLPLTDAPYQDILARPFFDNLLQERDGPLNDVMAREGIARDDVAGLLFHVGRDCAGAISILPQGSPPTKVPGEYAKDYLPLSSGRLAEIVRSLHTRRRLPDDMADPSPLAGVQSKVGLTLLPDGQLAEPIPGSGAPTTHILKVPDEGRTRDAALEAAAMDLSHQLGLETADISLLEISGVEAVLITRFDRALDSQGRIMRIHQEDFAQALGLAPYLKYERRGTEGRRFDVEAVRRVLGATNDPAVETEKFIRSTLFDLMIGNVDAHAKNFALLFGPGGGVRTAPRYDILPTRLDPTLTEELAYRIGDARTIDDVTADNFDAFLGVLGMASAPARRRARSRYATDIAARLAERLSGVQQAGHKRFADLMASNIRLLGKNLGFPIPDPARDRDSFAASGGGWAMS